MKNRILKVHPEDNVVVALTGLKKDDRVSLAGMSYLLSSDVPAKHKFATAGIPAGDGHHWMTELAHVRPPPNTTSST